MKMKRRMEENESVLFIPKRANVFTCLMSIGSLDKKKRTRKDVDNVEMMMTTTMTMKERNTRNGWYSSCSFTWMSELMQFAIHYFILDQINNDNYTMQRKSAVAWKKSIRIQKQKRK